MLTSTFKLNWPDGAEVSAQISASGGGEEVPVLWSGDLERVAAADQFETADSSLLRIIFRNIARQHGAEMSEDSSGVYDYDD